MGELIGIIVVLFLVWNFFNEIMKDVNKRVDIKKSQKKQAIFNPYFDKYYPKIKSLKTVHELEAYRKYLPDPNSAEIKKLENQTGRNIIHEARRWIDDDIKRLNKEFAILQEKREKERIAKIKSAEETRKAIERQQFSYVYVLGNESMPGIVKIGYTDRKPMLRAIELSSATGVPTPFKVLKEYPFATLTRAQKEEERLHSLFEKNRVNTNREFFRLSVNQVDREIRDNIKTKELSSATNVPTPFESEAFLSSNSPELEEKKRYTQLEKSRANYQQVEFREKESVNAGIYAVDPGANTAKYAFKCKACGKNFFSINPMNVSTVCPHCLKKP